MQTNFVKGLEGYPVITPVLKKIVQNDPERRGKTARDWSSRGSDGGSRSRSSETKSDRRVIDL